MPFDAEDCICMFSTVISISNEIDFPGPKGRDFLISFISIAKFKNDSLLEEFRLLAVLLILLEYMEILSTSICP